MGTNTHLYFSHIYRWILTFFMQWSLCCASKWTFLLRKYQRFATLLRIVFSAYKKVKNYRLIGEKIKITITGPDYFQSKDIWKLGLENHKNDQKCFQNLINETWNWKAMKNIWSMEHILFCKILDFQAKSQSQVCQTKR